jgi:hypothetical protein
VLAHQLQRILNETIAHGSWENSTLRWLPSERRSDESTHDVLANRSILLLGDSTVRDMLAHLTGAPPAEPWRASAAWRVHELGCDERVGSGCSDCWACCAARCSASNIARGGRRSFIPYSKRVADAVYVHRGVSMHGLEHATSLSRGPAPSAP